MGIYYSKEHEWIKLDDDSNNEAVLGISEHAAEELGDITFVELPEIDAELQAGDTISVIESVKAASDVFTPIGGKVLRVNTKLEDEPGLINFSPEEDGWICVLKEIDTEVLGNLMNEKEYAEYIN